MSKLVHNYPGGTTDDYGTDLALNRFLQGDVIEGFAVVANGTPNMTVLVQTGSGRITTGTYPSSYGYLISHDTTAGESVTVPTAAASPRIDYIVAYIDKGVTGSTNPSYVNNTNNVLKFADVSGTPAGSPLVPTVAQIQTAIGASNPYIILAQIAVGASVTTITNPNITDMRKFITPISTGVGTVYRASLATAPGEIGGTWTSVTPAFTNIVPGTGFYQIMRYAKVGKTVICNVGFQLGSGGSVTGSISMTLPVNAAGAMVSLGAGWNIHAGNCVFVKNATAEFNGTVEITNNTTASFFCMHVNGTVIDMAGTGATTPFSWGQYDRMYATLIYEAA